MECRQLVHAGGTDDDCLPGEGFGAKYFQLGAKTCKHLPGQGSIPSLVMMESSSN